MHLLWALYHYVLMRPLTLFRPVGAVSQRFLALYKALYMYFYVCVFMYICNAVLYWQDIFNSNVGEKKLSSAGFFCAVRRPAIFFCNAFIFFLCYSKLWASFSTPNFLAVTSKVKINCIYTLLWSPVISNWTCLTVSST